jgi:WD40 repeat protein
MTNCCSPYDENIIVAGCTSGSTYVWDIRRPDNILYILSHGKSLMPLDDFTDREVADTGVRFLSWGHNATRLYSGSSDGVVKVWDVVGSTEDVFIRDLMTVDSGIMSGAFSPDKSKLIIGEVNGTINVLEVGKDDYTVKDADRLQYLSYQNPINDDNDSVGDDDATAQADSGRAIAYESLMTGQMITQLMGGFPIYQSVQGPNYDGPYDSSIDAPFLRQQALEFQLNLAVTPDAQCTLPACISNDFSKITFEETGDSGRSVDRIPDELRKQWKILGSEHKTIPGKVKCTDCYRPARPVESTASVGETALCERCSFACFRCGSINKVMPEMEILMCRTCERIWEIGALGYECVKETAYIPLRAGEVVMSPKAKGIADWNERASKALGGGASLEESSTFGDEVNALTDYYLGLAIDRLESPSL